AAQYMNRPITYDEFCRRCEKQGRSQVTFGRLHADPVIQRYCQLAGADETWRAACDGLAERVRRARDLESRVASGRAGGGELAELHALYKETFEAHKTKGIVEALHSTDRRPAHAETAPTGRAAAAGQPERLPC